MIAELKIENFKSFGSDMPVLELGPLNFLVGANASGRSNLVAALRFLKMALLQNVEIAVAEFGGAGEIRNKIQRERKEAKPLRIQIRINQALSRRIQLAPRIRISEFAYTVEIDLRSSNEVPAIEREIGKFKIRKGNRLVKNTYWRELKMESRLLIQRRHRLGERKLQFRRRMLRGLPPARRFSVCHW